MTKQEYADKVNANLRTEKEKQASGKMKRFTKIITVYTERKRVIGFEAKTSQLKTYSNNLNMGKKHYFRAIKVITISETILCT